MLPTNRDLRVLHQLREWREQAPRVTQLLDRGWRGYLLLSVTATVVLVASCQLGMAWAGAAICGLVLGAVLRDLRWCRATVLGWPLTAALIDWARVDALLTPAPTDTTPSSEQAPTP